MSILNEFDYTPNNIESDIILSEIPVSLMMENISRQFNEPLEYDKIDFIANFITKYQYSIEQVSEEENDDDNENTEDQIEELNELRDKFYGFMLDMFKTYFQVGVVNFSDMPVDKQDDVIHFVYRFFVINMKKNFTNFILNWIDENKSSYSENVLRKRDVTTLSFKREVTDPDDIAVLANLADIIDSILSQADITVDLFLSKCDGVGDPCLETSFVDEMYNNCELTGNFVNRYISMIDSDLKSEIEIKVRHKILKKYKKKKI